MDLQGEIIQADIDTGCAGEESNCAAALAVRRALMLIDGWDEVAVNEVSIRVTEWRQDTYGLVAQEHVWTTPQSLADFIRAVDDPEHAPAHCVAAPMSFTATEVEL